MKNAKRLLVHLSPTHYVFTDLAINPQLFFTTSFLTEKKKKKLEALCNDLKVQIYE